MGYHARSQYSALYSLGNIKDGGMKVELKAVLFDTRSIQKYIFSGNKLRTNIGASYLVDRVFDDALIAVLKTSLTNEEVDESSWKENQRNDYDWEDMPKKCRVAYIGGGNALILFKQAVEDECIKDIVTDFSRKVLLEYPGLHTGAAIGIIRIDKEGYYLDEDGERLTPKNNSEKNTLTQLVRQLKKQQNTSFPLRSIQYTGMTLACEATGEAAIVHNYSLGRDISAELDSKMYVTSKNSDKLSLTDASLLNKLNGVGNLNLEGYSFPMNLEDLGQKETESYIAIVHIDGNNMGRMFSRCNTLTLRKNRSLEVRKNTIDAFCELLKTIISKDYVNYERFLSLGKDEKGNRFLPIRPIVLGGDDMTFVCTAKLAILYAKRIMERLKKLGIWSCCGITIQPVNYPFFRGYELAEQLCSEAKKSMRAIEPEIPMDKVIEENVPKRKKNNKKSNNKKNAGSCWLDYAIIHGEQPSSLSQLREQSYRRNNGDSLHFGPYRLLEKGDVKSLDKLEDLLMQIQEMPSGKIKDLRNVLTRGEHERIKYIEQLNKLGINIPVTKGWEEYGIAFWHEHYTPYLDAIELIDYYWNGK